MANLYPKIQIFDFVPKIQVWSVTPDHIELFWFPLSLDLAKFYRVYHSTSYSGFFTLLKEVPNNWQASPQPPYTSGIIFTRIPKSDVGGADIIHYFKATSVKPDGTEIPLASVLVKPVFTIEEHRLKGRSYHRAGQTALSFVENPVPGSTYSDNVIDVLYTLGRVGTTMNFQVDNSEIYVKLNSINAFPIRVRDCETLELEKDDMDIYKIFYRSTAQTVASGATVQITVMG